MNRKHMPLLVGGLLVLVLAIGFLYWLFSAREGYNEGISSLSMVQGRLARLTSRAVFPSETNVQTLGKQARIYQDYLDGLYGAMREGQFPAESVPRARFPLVLEEVNGQLVNNARAKSVTLPADFSYGFQRYTAGNLPAEEEVERLVVQLRSVAALCEILYGAGIAELISVDRTVFEKDAQVAPEEEEYSRRNLRNRADTSTAAAASTELFKDPDGLFTKEHYVLSFRAPGPALWAVLDRLSKGSPFTVLTKVEVTNPARPAVVPPKTEETKEAPAHPVSTSGWQSAAPRDAAGSEKNEPEILPRELRIVAGQELPAVRLEVDLYRFAEAAGAAEKGEENP
jgi:hypothetical protein